MKTLFFSLTACALASLASAQMVITEWMYQGVNSGVAPEHEFVEFTNIGNTAIDMSGWHFGDSGGTPVFDLSGFGVVQAGESVVMTDIDAAIFRNLWNLDTQIKVVGNSNPGLGRNDAINLFDQANNLIDSLAYGDVDFGGTFRSRYNSGNILLSEVGKGNIYAAVQSQLGDSFGSWASASGDIGNPGVYSMIPEPETVAALLAMGLLGVVVVRRVKRS